MPPQIFAHRGNSSEAPENTMAAFRRVPGSGAAGVEFDVHLSREGIPVVIHDEYLGRTSDGSGAVGDHSWEELRRLDAGSWLRPEFSGESIPRLSEVLAFFAETALEINIELKTSLVPYPGLVPKVVALVQAMKVESRVLFSSFNHYSLLEAAAIAPEIPRAAALSDVTIAPWDYALAHGFQALHPDYRICTPEWVAACHERGLAVRPYTVDSEADFRALAKMGVEAVFTNRPRALARLA